MQYYIYILSDPRNHIPFYVGQGKRNRKLKRERYKDHIAEARLYMNGKRWPKINVRKLETIQSILLNELEPEVDIIFETDNRLESDQAEINTIALIGRLDKGTGSLTNMTDGGTGGITHDPALHSDAHSKAMKKYWDELSIEAKKRLLAARGAGIKAFWAALPSDEKIRRMKSTLLSDELIQENIKRLQENGYYQADSERNERRRTKCSATMQAKWDAMEVEERKAFQQAMIDWHASVSPERKLEINIKRGESISKAYRDKPDKFTNCHSEETRKRRGEAIRQGWARRNANISQSERDALTVKRQAQGRISGETRRRQRELKNASSESLA